MESEKPRRSEKEDLLRKVSFFSNIKQNFKRESKFGKLFLIGYLCSFAFIINMAINSCSNQEYIEKLYSQVLVVADSYGDNNGVTTCKELSEVYRELGIKFDPLRPGGLNKWRMQEYLESKWADAF